MREARFYRISNDCVLLTVRSAHVTCYNASYVKADAKSGGRDAAFRVKLLHMTEDVHRNAHRMVTLLIVLNRCAEYCHEPVAQKLVYDAVMLVYNRNHEAKKGIQVGHNLGWRMVAGQTAEIAYVKEHHAYVTLAAPPLP